MEKNFPVPIKSERDLTLYEGYLKREVAPKTELKEQNLYEHLKSLKGKYVKVESLIGGRTEVRIGQLLSVGADYIVLKSQKGCRTLICKLCDIKYITVAHDNSPLL